MILSPFGDSDKTVSIHLFWVFLADMYLVTSWNKLYDTFVSFYASAFSYK